MRSLAFHLRWFVPTAAVACLATAALAQPELKGTSAGVIRGSGSRVATISLTRSSPLVITAVHHGESNFIVRLVGPTTDYVFNEIGSYTGQAAVSDVKKGRYRVAVQADGTWSLTFAQPTPSRAAKLIPGTIRGHGARVIAVRTSRHLQPVVTATHRGKANFIVHLIGYGGTTGEEYLFNEIGNFHGQTLVDDLPKGAYLLYVQADGNWTVSFAP
jgi:hypothetical protein